jgi:hypothetical protein
VAIIGSILAALGLGVFWVLVLRKGSVRTRIIQGPKGVRATLDAYSKGKWEVVAADGPALLAGNTDDDEGQWRPALELAIGQSLLELGRAEEAIPHLERGLLLQSAWRRAHGRSDTPDPGEAKLRHLLGYAYYSIDRPAQARREYRRVLEMTPLDPAVRVRVEASLSQLD